jgi:hypothetical protein
VWEDLKSIEEYLRGVDPFDIPLDKYRSIVNNDEYSSLASRIIIERLHELHGDWIKKKLEESKAQSIVVCNGKVIYSSRKRYEPSDEELKRMEEEMGKPCYVITGEPLIEEQSSWSILGVDDYFYGARVGLFPLTASTQPLTKSAKYFSPGLLTVSTHLIGMLRALSTSRKSHRSLDTTKPPRPTAIMTSGT